MVTFLVYSVLYFFSPHPVWLHNLDEAKAIARKEHRHILLNFSGSDWCGPCVIFRKDVLDDTVFLKMADTSLVLVNADFPRRKKGQLPAAQQAINNSLADEYNAEGQFPRTLLLNAAGKTLKIWDGNPGMKADMFAKALEVLIRANMAGN